MKENVENVLIDILKYRKIGVYLDLKSISHDGDRLKQSNKENNVKYILIHAT